MYDERGNCCGILEEARGCSDGGGGGLQEREELCSLDAAIAGMKKSVKARFGSHFLVFLYKTSARRDICTVFEMPLQGAWHLGQITVLHLLQSGN